VIEIRLVLRNTAELVVLQNTLAAIEAARKAEDDQYWARTYDSTVDAKPTTEAPVREIHAPQVETRYGAGGALDQAPAPEPQADGATGDLAPLVQTEVSEADAIAALSGLITNHGVPRAVELLGEFGVKRVTELSPEQRGQFVVRAAA
jgi:hypothetical protein